MKNEEYLFNLIGQFKTATGCQNIDINSREFISDFNAWRSRNRINGEHLLNLLDNLGIIYDTPLCAEIGKGKYDSLVIPYETTIITPYIEGLDKRPYDGKVIESYFQVLTGAPLLTSTKNDISADVELIKPEKITTFMTYNNPNIKGWHELHHNPHNAVIVGVYGKNYDKDKEQKLKSLRELRALLFDTYIEDSIDFGDNYCYVLATDKIEKERKRVKQR